MWNVKKVNVSEGAAFTSQLLFEKASNDAAKRNGQLVVFIITGSLSFAPSVVISHSGFSLLTVRGTVQAKQTKRTF